MPVDNNKYLKKTFLTAEFPDDPYKRIKVSLNNTIKNKYLPVLNKLDYPKGLRLLMTAMCHQEGFTEESRSFRTNNPGNVGNTDSGANNKFKTLEDGIKGQAEHLRKIANGKNKNYPKVGSEKVIPPAPSEEIKRNPSYGLPYNLPGYKFIYTGQLDQVIKIYSTGARVTNGYLNTIVSYFADNGINITPESKIQDIIELN